MEEQKPVAPFYSSLLASARAFHELVFKTLTSSLMIALLQGAATRSKSLILVFLLVLSYSALAVFTICFARFVLFASFEQAAPESPWKRIAFWIAAGLITGFVVALPTVFGKVVGALLRADPF